MSIRGVPLGESLGATKTSNNDVLMHAFSRARIDVHIETINISSAQDLEHSR